MNSDMLSRRLMRCGHEVEIVENGVLCLEAVARRRPDLVLMDLGLPVMDGYEATRRLRLEPGMFDLPIIALTAHAMPEDHARALEVGCDDYDVKPVDLERLLKKMAALLPDPNEPVLNRSFSEREVSEIRHDLRTSLNQIQGYGDLIRDEAEGGGNELSAWLDAIESEGARLLELTRRYLRMGEPASSEIFKELMEASAPIRSEIRSAAESLHSFLSRSGSTAAASDAAKIIKAIGRWSATLETLSNSSGESC